MNIMRFISPLFSFFTAVFFLGFHQRTAGFLFSLSEGIYPSFRPAKASEVPGANKSHWLFVTLSYQLETLSLSCQEALPKDVNITQLPCTSFFFHPPMHSFGGNVAKPLAGSDRLHLILWVPSCSFIYVPLTRRGCRTNLTGQPTARRYVLFLEGNIHAFFSLSLSGFPSLPLVSLKRSWCTVAKENNHDVSRALCKIDFKTGGW